MLSWSSYSQSYYPTASWLMLSLCHRGRQPRRAKYSHWKTEKRNRTEEVWGTVSFHRRQPEQRGSDPGHLRISLRFRLLHMHITPIVMHAAAIYPKVPMTLLRTFPSSTIAVTTFRHSCTLTYTYTHTHTHTYKNTYMYVYIYTHSGTSDLKLIKTWIS